MSLDTISDGQTLEFISPDGSLRALVTHFHRQIRVHFSYRSKTGGWAECFYRGKGRGLAYDSLAQAKLWIDHYFYLLPRYPISSWNVIPCRLPGA
tara:strand:- start:6710 stop:6994 length:285 start_codon:yes stop_codon:yes gene_type:complete